MYRRYHCTWRRATDRDDDAGTHHFGILLYIYVLYDHNVPTDIIMTGCFGLLVYNTIIKIIAIPLIYGRAHRINRTIDSTVMILLFKFKNIIKHDFTIYYIASRKGIQYYNIRSGFN